MATTKTVTLTSLVSDLSLRFFAAQQELTRANELSIQQHQLVLLNQELGTLADTLHRITGAVEWKDLSAAHKALASNQVRALARSFNGRLSTALGYGHTVPTPREVGRG